MPRKQSKGATERAPESPIQESSGSRCKFFCYFHNLFLSQDMSFLKQKIFFFTL
jgi:hypothetical protein